MAYTSLPEPVNNAGFVLGVEKIGDIADADIEGMFAVNVLGLISVTQLFVKRQSSPSTSPVEPLPSDTQFSYRLQGQELRSRHQPRICRWSRTLREWRHLLCDEARRQVFHWFVDQGACQHQDQGV